MPEEESFNPTDETLEAPELPTAEPRGDWRRTLRANWPGPALVLSLALLVGALAIARNAAKGHDFPGALSSVERLLEAGHPREALEALNERILPHIDDPAVTLADRGRFFALRGDALYETQQAIGPLADDPANSLTILSNYEEAERAMWDLNASQRARMAGVLMALDRFEEAVAEIRAIPEDAGGRRHRLLRQALERRLMRDVEDDTVVLELLNGLAEGDTVSQRDRLWAVARLTELRLESGQAEEALARLLRVISRLSEAPNDQKAELYTLLAWSYYELGRFDQARRHLEIADGLVRPTDNIVAEIQTLRARIEQIDGDLGAAHEIYAETIDTFPELSAAVACAMGKAAIDAGNRDDEAALAGFGTVIERMPLEERRWRITTESVDQALSTWREARFIEGDYGASIEYARLGERLHGPEQVPPEIPLALAEAHDSLGRETLRRAGVDPDGLVELADLEPVTRAEARGRFIEAAEQYIRHARLVILADPEAFSDSLWKAGVAFDLAGDADRAIEVFSEYANGDPDDPRHPAALFRLGEAHQARGDYELARTFYQELIEKNPNSPEGQRSHIRLAQTLLRLGSEESVEQAEELLIRVVGSGMFTPEADERREGLFELGSMLYKQGRYTDAIQRLREAVTRYPDHEHTTLMRYKLADALRLSATEIEQTLAGAMPDRERAELETLREGRLAEAQELFTRVRDEVEAMDPLALDELDRRLLRNSMYYRADCAYELGDFENAIRWYDAAAQRYADDPSSLVAMMQIVNAYAAMGRWREAQTAQERARQRLSEIPDHKFDNPELPIDQRHWERWIANSPIVDAQASGRDAPETP